MKVSYFVGALWLTAASSFPAETFHRLETVEEIKAMPRCIATVTKRTPCSAGLKTSDGKKLHLGSPDAPGEVVSFLSTLKVGQTYELPDAFSRFQEAQRRK